MAQYNARRSGEIQRALLQILSRVPEGLQAKEALLQVEASLILTDYEKADYPNRPGVRRFSKLVRFSSIPLVKAGWMIKTTGIWMITTEGAKALKQYTDPEEFRRASVAKYQEWVAGQPHVEPEGDEAPDGESSLAKATLEEAEEAAWTEISDHLSSMPPYDFQELVGGLLRGMGYRILYISPPGPDQGIDILAHTDPLGVQGTRVKVQVKRRADKMSVDGVHSFMSLLGDNDAGVFFATGGFTSEAHKVSRAESRRRIMLIDAEGLVDLWIEHYGKIPDEQRRLLPLKPIHYLNLGE